MISNDADRLMLCLVCVHQRLTECNWIKAMVLIKKLWKMVANSSTSTVTHESSDHRPLNFSHIKAPFTHYQCQDSSGEDATYETIISQILKTVCPMTSLHSLRVIYYVHKGIYALTKCRSHFNNFLHVTQIHSICSTVLSVPSPTYM